MKDLTNGELQKIKDFAARTCQSNQLNKTLENLKIHELRPGGEKDPETEIYLYPDFAPYSMQFSIKRNGKQCLNGGIIYHGKHDNGGDGSAPTFSVSLEPTQGWSIHT